MFIEIKWKLQKLFRGYSDCDLWCLDQHLAGIIHNRLVAFRKLVKNGYPLGFDNVDEWDVAIDKMIYAFKRYYDNDLAIILLPPNDRKIVDEKVSEGVKLFTKHYFALWD